MYYDKNTAHTPSKEGVSTATEGLAFITGNPQGYRSIFCIPKAGHECNIHITAGGEAVGWYKLVYIGNSTSDGLAQIHELDVGSLTLEGYASQSFDSKIKPYPVIDGYTCVGVLGGHGAGDTGLQFSAGSVWVYNPAPTQKSWTNVIFDLLYVKS